MWLTIQGVLYFLYFYFIERYRWRSVFGYVLSTKFFFRIRFSSASRAHPSQEGLW